MNVDEIVVILDANPSMGEEISANDDDDDLPEIDGRRNNENDTTSQSQPRNHRAISEDCLGTTKFDVARCIVRELLFHAEASTRSKDNNNNYRTSVLSMISLGGTPPFGIRTAPDPNISPGTKRKRPGETPNDEGENKEIEGWIIHNDSQGGFCCCCYSNDDQSSLGWLADTVSNTSVSTTMSPNTNNCDFVTGIVRATDAMARNTTVGATSRRIVLVTDARHKVLVPNNNPGEKDPLEALADAVNRLRALGCTLEVVGMGFRKQSAKGNDQNINGEETANGTAEPNSGSEHDSDGETTLEDDDDDDVSSDGEGSEDDWSEIQDENELLLMDLVEKVGGCVQAINWGSTSVEDNYCVRTVLKRLTRDSESENGVSSESSPSDSSSKVEGENNGDKERISESYRGDVAVEVKAVVGERDDSSLRPSPGTGILHWNGSDDVFLPDWLQTAMPSRWSGDGAGFDRSECCSWIQIDDPLRPPEAGDGSTNLQDTTQSTTFDFPALLDLVKFDGQGVPGNWVIECPLEGADYAWEKIAVATAYGKLGPTSRATPSKHMLRKQDNNSNNPGEKRQNAETVIICVGVSDSNDRTKIRSVFDALFGGIGWSRCDLLVFQPDVFADPGAYRGHLRPCLYTAEEVLAWPHKNPVAEDQK